MTHKLKDWINCGIYLKIYFRILGLGLWFVALAWHVSGLGLGLDFDLDTSGLVNISGYSSGFGVC